MKEDAATLYDKYGPDKFNLQDRGYLAHVHPLELWMLNYRIRASQRKAQGDLGEERE